MPTFVVLENDVVVNSVVAPSLHIAEQLTGLTCMQSDEAGIGFTWDPELGVFTPPSLPGV